MTAIERFFRRDLLIISAYLIITAFMTYPVLLNFFSHVPAVSGDAFLNLWNMWWLKKSVLDLGTTPYYTSYLFHPSGISLVFHTLSFFNSLASIPLHGILGLTGAYNVLFLFSFVFSGYGTYLLVKYLTGDFRAAFVAGIMFAFCPYRFAHALAGHLNLMGTEWIPFYVLYLIKTYKEAGKRNPIYAALFLFATALCDWHYIGFMVLFTGFFLTYHFWFERTGLSAGFMKRLALIIALFTVLILPFAYAPILALADGNYNPDYPKIAYAATFSADFFSFFLPSSLHPILGDYVKGAYLEFGGNVAEKTLFLGYVAIVLAFCYQLRNGRMMPYLSSKAARAKSLFKNRNSIVKLLWMLASIFLVCYMVSGFDAVFCVVLIGYALGFVAIYFLIKEKLVDLWSFMVIVFAVLSLGPFLHVWGTIYSGRMGLILALPGLLLYLAPVLSFLRDPGRFGLMVMLAMAVLSGYSLTDIFGRVRRKDFVMVFVSALVLFEFLSAPLALTDTRIPGVYGNISAEEGKFALLEVPMPVFCNGYSQFMYYQSKHEKSILGGSVSIVPTGTEDFLANTPVIQAFASPVALEYMSVNGRDAVVVVGDAYFRPGTGDSAALAGITNGTHISSCSKKSYYFLDRKIIPVLDQSYGQGDVLRQNNSIIGQSVLSHYGIRYVVIHDEYLNSSPGLLAAVDRLASEVMRGEPPVYSDGKIRFYRVGREEAMFMTLGRNWYSKELLEQTATRWMRNNATIEVINAKNRTVRLKFDARSLGKRRLLQVYLGDRLLGEFRIDTTYTHVDAGSIRLSEGDGTLVFYTPDGCEKQLTGLRAWKPEDESRCASISFQNISMVPEHGM